MKRYFSLFLVLCLGLINNKAASQILEPAHWTYDISESPDRIGHEIDLIFNIAIDDDWYMYSSDFDRDCGPMVTTFTFLENDSYQLIGNIEPINPKKKYDDVFECDYTYFRNKGQFKQRIKVLNETVNISGTYEYQVCTDVDGRCIPFDDEFQFNLKVGQEGFQMSDGRSAIKKETTAQRAEKNNEKLNGPVLSPDLTLNDKQNTGIGWFMLFSFLAGLAALLTPCVFPMIPMTVTFFTGKGNSFLAIFYGLSIVVIYTLIGAALAPIMGPEMANHLSTEWLPNLIFFVVFVVFALSFFGLFELTLPHSFVNKMDRKADKGGLVGVFFMAFTLVLVSFSCTGPIVGSILVESAGGQVVKPVLGMLSFSASFAIPFTIFAFFPSLLNSLPKSGGWLNSVKVVLGFLELAFAFKFLSIADQAFHWGILDREINIAIWIVIFSLLGFYLLGKIRLPNDSKVEIISVPRLILAIITFSFVVYLIPGMWGAPLKALAGYLPPMSTHDFDLVALNRTNPVGALEDQSICETPKYSSFLHLPHGLKGYFDYEQALACAREKKKPLFIDFTGHGCTNCREMEARVWSHPEVLERLTNDYVVVALYIDDKTELPKEEWYVSEYDGKVKKTIGKQNADLQISKLQNNAQPFYVLLDNQENVMVKPKGYDLNVDNFVKFLDEGKKIFYSKANRS